MIRWRFIAWLLSLLGVTAGRASSQTPSMMQQMMQSMMERNPDAMRSMHTMMSSPRGRAEVSQMMGSADQADMQVYMEMFSHHQEIRRSVHTLKNGIRTVTESTNPRIVSLLQAHVEKMYDHVAKGEEVRCMSDSLPTMFRNASRYQRKLTLTSHGVAVEETSDDPDVLSALHRHAAEVTSFVDEGMSAMMKGMMP